MIVLAILLAAITHRGTTFSQPQFPVTVTRDIVYGTDAVRQPVRRRKELLLDLYEPAAKGPRLRPAVIAIHGGALKRGDKAGPESLADLCNELASRGYVCAAIAHRLEPDDPDTRGKTLRDRAVVAAREDAEQALSWMRSNAAARRVDPSRIALAGRSAGAATSMRVARLQ